MKNPSQKLETGDWQLVVLLLISVFHFLISGARLRAQQPQTPSLPMPDVRSWFVDPNTQGPTVRADLMPGSDGGAKIIACIANLPATGGTCDARGLQGSQNWSTVTISKDVTILLACGVTFTYSGSSSLFLITGSPEVTIIGCGSNGLPYSPGYGGNTGAATLFTFNPSVAGTDAISTDSGSSSTPRLTLSGFRINGSTNTRDLIRLNSAGVMFVDISKMMLSGPAGGGAYTSGYAVNFNAPAPAALDFSRIGQVQIGWTTGGIRYGNANTTGSLVDQSQFASIAGRAIVGEYGIGQMTISRNTFIGCNQTTAGGAVHLKPNAGYTTSDITFIDNSYQGNGLAGAGSYDVYLDGTNGLVVGIHMLGEQFNDAGNTGAYAEVYAINTDGLFLEHPHLSDGQSGGHTSGLYIDSTNTNVHYLRGHIDGSSTEFINSAGVVWNSQQPNVFKVYAGTINPVSFSSTPTFDASLGNIQTITLTGNVTGSTLSNARAGETIDFVICQDSGGSHTFVWPTNVLGGMTIGSTASKCSAQSFIFNGTNAYALNTGAANM